MSVVDVFARAERRAARARSGLVLAPNPAPAPAAPTDGPRGDRDGGGPATLVVRPYAPQPVGSVGPVDIAVAAVAPTGPLEAVPGSRPCVDDPAAARPPRITDLLEFVDDAPTGPVPVGLVEPVGPVALVEPVEPRTDPFAAVAAVEAVEAEPVAAGGPRPRLLVRAAALAVLLVLTAAGATALAMDKTVTLTVDGQDRTLHTFAADVAGALDAAGITTEPQDRVEPALGTDVADGDEIIVNRARPLTLVEGGQERQVWTTAASVADALRGIGLEAQPLQMSASPDTAIPLGGMSLALQIPRTVTIADGTGAPVPVTTTAGTVGGLLAERGLQLGPDDVAVPRSETPLTDAMAVHVVRNGVGEVVEVRQIPPPEQVVEDPEMPRGEQEVVDPGAPGEQTAIMRVHVQDGQEVRREQVRAGAVSPPKPRVVKVGTNDDEPDPPATPTVADGGAWDRLAQCEAGGDWAASTGNGYYGGLQFDAQTWRAYDGTQYAALPHQASRGEQIAVASKVRDSRGGYSAWPACARKLRLPR